MSTPEELLTRQSKVRDAFAQNLDLTLTDSEVDVLLAGELLSIEQLIKNHSLTEVGMALIRLDTLSQVGGLRVTESSCKCNDGCTGVLIPVLGCVCSHNHRLLDLQLSSDFLGQL